MAARITLGALLAFFVACAAPVVKPEAFDPEALRHEPLPARLLSSPGDEEVVVSRSLAWMEADTSRNLVFVSYGPRTERRVYHLVLECDAEDDRLVLLPLGDGVTPLDVLDDPARRAELRRIVDADPEGSRPAGALELSLAGAIRDRLLGPPLPTEGRIFAVAANFPSHLEVDLEIGREAQAAIAETPPRVFQKHPPVPPPGRGGWPANRPYRGVIGPFDDLRYPARIQLPAVDEEGSPVTVPTALDYEVEVGAVLGRALDWEDVRRMDDEELYGTVAGYVLVSDVKARNPQVFERALAGDEIPASGHYLTGIGDVDLLIGNWGPETCAWWGYAASQGDYAALGPYFVAAEVETRFHPRPILCARAYGKPGERGLELPPGRKPHVLYLRQCSLATTEDGHRDRMLWDLPDILRGMLSPESALAFTPGARRLDRGDIVSLGTPGGIVLTVRGRTMIRVLNFLLFWWDARDWHDAFFDKDVEGYLHDGDEVFLWGEGLGAQHHDIRRVPE